MSSRFYDIAIVGAGAAGLYAAMRLSSETIKQSSIGLFESLNTVGGRIKSYHDESLGAPCELGCMRYLRDQTSITHLIEQHFQLEHQRFDTGDAGQHIYYLRDTWIDVQKWNNVPYSLPADYKRKSPFELLDNIIDEIRHNQANTGRFNQELIYPFSGTLYQIPLQQIGFAHLIAESSTYEILKFITDSGEYYAKTINWNAAEAFPYSQTIGYKSKDVMDYWCVTAGFSELCTNLLTSFLEHGGQIHDSMHLHAVSENPGGKAKYSLRFLDKTTQQYVTIFCNHLILALPLNALKKILWLSTLENLFYNDSFQNLLTAVRPLPVVRFALTFEQPWWENEFNGLNGHMVTDLPIRHGYYFGSSDASRHSVFLATVDMHQTDYWLSLLNQAGNAGDLPQALLLEILKQLKVIHKRNDIPMPVKALFCNWSSPHYGGGFHAWNPGYDVAQCMQQALKPFPSENIHIVGEAFSNIQGWVEGALSTVDELLKRFSFGLNSE